MTTTIQTILDQVPESVESLFGKKKSCRMSISYIKTLANSIAKDIGVNEDLFYNSTFLRWVKDNPIKASKHADTIVETLIVEKTGVVRDINKIVFYRKQAWKHVGVTLSNTMEENIKALQTSTSWTASQHQLQQQSDMAKKKQMASWQEGGFDKYVKHASTMDGEDFRNIMLEILQDPPSSISLQTREVLKSLSTSYKRFRKCDSILYAHLLKGVAYALYARASGIRGGHMYMSTLSDMVIIPGKAGIFQRFVNGKNGSRKTAPRECSVRIVPHKDPFMCPLVAMAMLVSYIYTVLGDHVSANRPFTFGMSFNPNNLVIGAEIVRKGVTASVEALAVASGMTNGIAGSDAGAKGKKLHLFRGLCANELIKLGSSKEERGAHIGWATSVDDRYYSQQLNIAAAAKTPYLLAGRTGPDDSPHSMWAMLASVPPDLIPDDVGGTLKYLLQVNILALAAGFTPSHYRQQFKVLMKEPSFITFSKRVSAHIAVSINASNRASVGVVSLKRQLQETETELEVLRRKLLKYETPVVDPLENATAADLQKAIGKLVQHKKCEDFIEKCKVAVEATIKPLIEKLSRNDGFGIPLQKGMGPTLIQLLLLVAAAKKVGDAQLVQAKKCSSSKSWLSWVKLNRRKGVFAGIATNKWSAIKDQL